ncbi:MAG: hypothetical protein ABI832_21890 [bacterium]
MTTPFTITSLAQGRIAPKYTSDETYWAQFRADPAPVPQGPPRWYAARTIWPFWRLLKRA